MVPNTEGRRGADRSSLHRTARLAGVGLQFAAAIVLFLFAGQWLDERFGTSPWFVLLGVFVGFMVGIYWMYRQLVTAPREQMRRRGEQQ